MNYEFKSILVHNIQCINITEDFNEFRSEIFFFFTVFNDGMSFVLNKFFLDSDVNCEQSIIRREMKFWMYSMIIEFQGVGFKEHKINN